MNYRTWADLMSDDDDSRHTRTSQQGEDFLTLLPNFDDNSYHGVRIPDFENSRQGVNLLFSSQTRVSQSDLPNLPKNFNLPEFMLDKQQENISHFVHNICNSVAAQEVDDGLSSFQARRTLSNVTEEDSNYYNGDSSSSQSNSADFASAAFKTPDARASQHSKRNRFTVQADGHTTPNKRTKTGRRVDARAERSEARIINLSHIVRNPDVENGSSYYGGAKNVQLWPNNRVTLRTAHEVQAESEARGHRTRERKHESQIERKSPKWAPKSAGAGSTPNRKAHWQRRTAVENTYSPASAGVSASPCAATEGPPEATEEDWVRRVAQREKQIAIGKSTQGYQNYLRLQSNKEKRDREDPRTPDPHDRVSKRAFDGRLQKWRVALHKYDHLTPLPGGDLMDQLNKAADELEPNDEAAPLADE